VPLIKEELALAQANARMASLENYRHVGEYLWEAKKQVPKGEWGGWLSANFKLTARTARTYMDLDNEMRHREVFSDEQDENLKPASNFQPREFKTLSEFQQPGRGSHQPEWHAPVQQVITQNIDLLRQRQQDKEKERRLMKVLALQLIDIGYKVLATKLHPDKGGSREAMQRLNRVRDLLKQSI
jgi:hypothetical protein